MGWVALTGTAWAGDKDGDGIANKVDRCLEVPEDKDEFQDDDGCPDPDNDEDGIMDVNDACPAEPEDKDQFEDDDGCPDPDNDRDGVLDGADRCATEREDGEDGDGCSTVTLQLLTETGWMASVGKLNSALLTAASDPDTACSAASRVAGAWLDNNDAQALAAEWNGRLQRAGTEFDGPGANALLAGKGEVYREIAPALELLCRTDSTWASLSPQISAVYASLPPLPPPAKKRRR